MKSWTSSFWMLSLLVTVAVLTTGCGRLRPNGNGEPGSAVATFTAAPGIAAPTEPVAPTAAPTTAPTELPATEAPAPTTVAAQSDPSGDALDDLLGELLNSVADDPTYQGELDQIP